MAARFWVGGTALWTAINLTNWSATSGGAGGASVPGAGDDVTFDGASGGGIVTVGPAFNPVVNSIAMGAFTGTLDFSANNNNITMSTFSCSGTGTRTLNMGSGTWTISGNAASVFNVATITGLTLTGTGTINFNYSGSTGTRTIQSSVVSFPNNMNISAGSDNVNFSVSTGSGTMAGNIDFTGFTGTLTGGSGSFLAFLGNLTFGSGMTIQSVDDTHTWGADGSSLQTITSNGVTLNHSLTLGTSAVTGTSIILADDLTLGSGYTLTSNKGIFNANNKNVTCGIFNVTGTQVRTLTMGSGTWTLTGTGTVWAGAVTTNLTFNANTSTIVINNNSSAANTFSGGGLTFNNLTFARGVSIGNNVIIGSNTFATLADTGTIAHSFLFTAGTTTTFTTWNINGQAGNLITLSSVTAATHTLKNAGSTDVVANYLAISYSVAT